MKSEPAFEQALLPHRSSTTLFLKTQYCNCHSIEVSLQLGWESIIIGGGGGSGGGGGGSTACWVYPVLNPGLMFKEVLRGHLRFHNVTF